MFRDIDKNTLRKFLVFYFFSSISQWVFYISLSCIQRWNSHWLRQNIVPSAEKYKPIHDYWSKNGTINTAEGQNAQLFVILSALAGLESKYTGPLPLILTPLNPNLYCRLQNPNLRQISSINTLSCLRCTQSLKPKQTILKYFICIFSTSSVFQKCRRNKMYQLN